MKTYILITVHAVCAIILATAACSGPVSAKIKGQWRSTDNETLLKITGKQFTMENDSPVPEDYFVKGDTIYTSFQGNLPYSKFVIKQVDDHQMKLQYPDSAMVEFIR
jgi:hypothetical protein